jgi:hypothetical protein
MQVIEEPKIRISTIASYIYLVDKYPNVASLS